MDERQRQIFLPLRRSRNGICYVFFSEEERNFSDGNGDYGNGRTATQGRIQKMNLEGANSGGPPAGSRGGAPVRGLGDEVPRS